MIVFSQILMCSAGKQQSDLCCIYVMSAVHVTNQCTMAGNKSDDRYFRLSTKTCIDLIKPVFTHGAPGPGRQIFRGGILKKSRLKYGML